MSTKWPSFDELAALAKEQPEKLEEFRQKEVERLISNAPERMHKRLRGLQFEVDAQRKIHKTPMASCIAISNMMYKSLRKLNHALNGEYITPSTPHHNAQEQSKVVQFPVAAS